MPYQPDHLYKTLPNPQSSAFSRPRRDALGSYEIHFIKSEDPTYIPEDFEAWPLYHRSILDLLGSPIGAMHSQGSSTASIRKGKREQGSRKGRQDRHKTGLRGYRALQGRVLAGYGQQEQGNRPYPGGDPALSVTTGLAQAARL